MQDETISNSACSIREKTDGYMKNMVREKGVWEGKPRRRDIRMIALDLDGTALNKEMKVTERTAEALEEAARRGHSDNHRHRQDVSYAAGAAF